MLRENNTIKGRTWWLQMETDRETEREYRIELQTYRERQR